MKLQISYEFINLSEALDMAKETSQFADILEVGTLLIYKEGVKAIEMFKKEFPQKEILADAKICDRSKEAVEIFAKAGANYISVLAGTSNETIHNATQMAHSLNAKVALDLIDSYSTGQSAMDAENLGVDLLVFIRAQNAKDAPELADEWGSTTGNTKLPILIAGNISRNNIKKVLSLQPYGIAVGRAITKAENPAQEAEYFQSLIKEPST